MTGEVTPAELGLDDVDDDEDEDEGSAPKLH